MLETLMPNSVTDNRNDVQATFTPSVVYENGTVGQPKGMLTTADLLSLLEERQIRNKDIANALGVTPSRVTEIKKGERSIKLDEAVKLVAAFGLELPQGPPVAPVPVSVARLIVLYVAVELGLSPGREERVEELAQDIRAFSEFAADPKVRSSVELSEAFFQAMRLRRPRPEPEAQRESDRPLSE